MRHLKLSLIGLLTFTSGLVLSGCSGSFVRNSSAAGTLSVSSSTVNFGQVAVGKTVSSVITVTNNGSAAVAISDLNLTGQSFSMSESNAMPMTVGANASVTITLQFGPTASGSASGQLTIDSNASNGSSTSVALSGTGVPLLTELTCVNGSITGTTIDACTVTLNAAAASGGLAVSLTSNDSAVTVPASVTVPAGATSAQFSASASAVPSAQAAMLTASAGGVAQTFSVELGAATAILQISASSITFGSVSVGSATTHPLILSSTGTMPVTVSNASLTGSRLFSSRRESAGDAGSRPNAHAQRGVRSDGGRWTSWATFDCQQFLEWKLDGDWPERHRRAWADWIKLHKQLVHRVGNR